MTAYLISHLARVIVVWLKRVWVLSARSQPCYMLLWHPKLLLIVNCLTLRTVCWLLRLWLILSVQIRKSVSKIWPWRSILIKLKHLICQIRMQLFLREIKPWMLFVSAWLIVALTWHLHLHKQDRLEIVLLMRCFVRHLVSVTLEMVPSLVLIIACVILIIA